MIEYLSAMRSWMGTRLHDERGTVASNYAGLIAAAVLTVAVATTLVGDDLRGGFGTFLCSLLPGGCN